MERNNVRMLVEGGLAIAMATVLGYITIFQMPQGGAVKAANLVPLLIYSYRWGGRTGIVTCAAYGILHFLVGMKFSIHYLSILLDYVCAYGAVGVAGFFRPGHKKAILGAFVAGALRYFSSVISGAVVFGAYAPAGQNPWVYSLIYNMTYMFPDLAINIAVIAIFYTTIMKRLGTV